MNGFLKKFIQDRKNIYSAVAVLFGILSIIMFLLLPSIVISLTPEGHTISQNVPDMVGYHESLTGAEFLFGGSTVNVWKTEAQGNKLGAVLETHNINFNIFAFAGMLLVLLSTVGLIVLTILKKNNIANKFILGGYIVAVFVILLSAVWFYTVNDTIIASTRYETSLSLYPYSGINANIGIGTILSTLFAVISSVMSGLLIIKPHDDNK